MDIDFPAWVQAIGSIIAIFAAIRIARTQERQRRREALDAASVTAALVETTLSNICAAIEGVDLAHQEIATHHNGLLNFIGAVNRVLAAPLPTEDQLIRLTASHSAGAEKLADLRAKLEKIGRLLPTINWSADARGDHGAGLSATDGLLNDLSNIKTMAETAQSNLSLFRFSVGYSREETAQGRLDSRPAHYWSYIKRAFRNIWP